MTVVEVTQLVELVGQFGFSVVFLWLFMREVNAHEMTRAQYRADLREIAGLRAEAFVKKMSEDETEPRPPEGLGEALNGQK